MDGFCTAEEIVERPAGETGVSCGVDNPYGGGGGPIRSLPELELLPILAIETRPFWRLPDGVTGVPGVRPPPEDVRETFPGVPGVRAILELLPGVPGVLGVLAGVPGNRFDPPFVRWSITEWTLCFEMT